MAWLKLLVAGEFAITNAITAAKTRDIPPALSNAKNLRSCEAIRRRTWQYYLAPNAVGEANKNTAISDGVFMLNSV